MANLDWISWVTLVELPALAGLGWWLMLTRRQQHEMQIKFYEQWARHRLEVARNYVTISYLKDVEVRLTDHLIRIEQKLDQAD